MNGGLKVAVVGGGITGCVTALSLCEEGHEVTLFELGRKLGGSLFDVHDETGFWYSGCQYLTEGVDWLATLQSSMKCDFYTFPHRYELITRCGNRTIYEPEMAAPVLPASLVSLPEKIGQRETMRDWFSSYGEDAGRFLGSLAERCGHGGDRLAGECAIALQMGAVMIDADPAELKILKARDPVADRLFFLPHRVRDSGNVPPRAVLPRDGFDVLFREFHRVLEERGVRIVLRSGITARAVNGKHTAFAAFIGSQELDAHLTVWCCNPTVLMLAAGFGKIDSPVSKFRHVHCELSGVEPIEPFYLQCFDPASQVLRVFVYPAGRRMKVCVECFPGPEQSVNAAISFATECLRYTMTGAMLEPRHVSAFTAHYLFTPRDRGIFAAFNAVASKNRFVSGAWEEFGRNQKIARIRREAEALISELRLESMGYCN